MKAQVSEEFILVFLAVILTFVLFLYMYLGQLTNIQSTSDQMQAEQIAFKLGHAINYVAQAGEGATYNLTIVAPRANITVAGSFVTVENAQSGVFSQTQTIANVTTVTINNSGITYIKNTGGTIWIN